jgi:hypothetical protein
MGRGGGIAGLHTHTHAHTRTQPLRQLVRSIYLISRGSQRPKKQAAP